MEIYDIIMLIVLVGAMVFGAIKGFAWQLASIASILVSYMVAYKYRQPFSQSIQADPPWNRFLAMLILYVGTALLIWVVFRMIRGTIDRMKLREFDRQVGAVFGLAKGGLYCILITLFAVTLMGDRVRQAIVRSQSGRYIAQVLDRSQAIIPPEIHDVVGPYLQRFDEQFHDSQEDGLLERIPWLADDQDRALPSGVSDGLGRLPSAAAQVIEEASDQASSTWSPNAGWRPADPRTFAPKPQPQQAFQPTLDGFQR